MRCSDACCRSPLLLCALSLAMAGLSEAARARQEPANAGRQWAVLIGIDKYLKAPNLVYTVNDVKQVGQTLRQRGGYREECILEMTDSSADRFQPSCARIRAELSAWLTKAHRKADVA